MAGEQLIRTMGIDTRSEMLKLEGLDIHYIKAGSGPPVLLVHGINFGWGLWYKNIPELAKYFTVYALDLPGAGGSSRINFKQTDIALLYPKVVKAFVRQLITGDLCIVGHSVGGWLAIKLCLENSFPIKKLALVDALGFSQYLVWKQRLLVFSFMADFLSNTVMRPTLKNMRDFLGGVFLDVKKMPAELVEYYQKSVSVKPVSHPFRLINKLIEPFRVRPEFVFGNELNKISQQTGIFFGEQDPLLPLKKNQPSFAKIPHQKTFIIPLAGHVPQVENPETFNTLLVNFLKE